MNNKELEKQEGLIKANEIEGKMDVIKRSRETSNVINPPYNKNLEQIVETEKRVDIHDKIELSKPQMTFYNEKILNTFESNRNQIKTLMPTYPKFMKFENSMLFDDISTKIGALANQQLSLVSENILNAVNSISNTIMRIIETQLTFINSAVETLNKNIIPAFKSLLVSLDEARNNPDSLLSWMNYYDKLSEFFWIMPYKITTEELYEILNNAETEKEFDRYINRYFNKEKVNLLINDIKSILTNNNQRKIFNQIVEAYKSKAYALASIGMVTMIDNALSYYLIDKGCTSRINLFEPIINDLELKGENSNFSFIVMMVNSNINLLYEQIEFNNKIHISTNKKSRRNPISHGKSYSYKKIDTIMLMNTLYYLLIIQSELKEYKNSLYRNQKKKEFYIPSKEEKRIIKLKIKSKF